MRRRLRRTVWPLLGTIVFLGVLLGGVFPTRIYLAQRSSTARAEEQLQVLGEQNDALEAQARRLRDDAEIERIAREQYGLVRPGEEVYSILPVPAPPPTAPPAPTSGDGDGDEDGDGLLERAWGGLTGWL